MFVGLVQCLVVSIMFFHMCCACCACGRKNTLSMLQIRCVNRLAWSEDGCFLASGSDDRSLRVWRYTGAGAQRPLVVDTHHQVVMRSFFLAINSRLQRSMHTCHFRRRWRYIGAGVQRPLVVDTHHQVEIRFELKFFSVDIPKTDDLAYCQYQKRLRQLLAAGVAPQWRQRAAAPGRRHPRSGHSCCRQP